MANAVIILVLLIICIFSIKSYAKKLSYGCCGSGGDIPRKIAPKDKNKKNYPFEVKIGIDGMSCGNCRLRVENAFNDIEGVWAKVNLNKKCALIRTKTKISEDKLRETVDSLGYCVTYINNIM